MFHPSADFLCFYRPFPIISNKLGYSSKDYRVCIRLSVVPNFFCVVSILLWLLGLPFSFFRFLPSLLYFGSYRLRSPAFFLPICLAGLCIVTCGSPLSSLLLARSLSLRCFKYLPCDSFAWVEFFSLIFSLLTIFVFGSFCLRDAKLFTYWCVPFAFNSFYLAFQWSSFSFFLFCIRWSRFRCFVSFFCMILTQCFALLAASLSFSFFICAGFFSSLPVLSVSSSLPPVDSCTFSRHCSLIFFPV